MFLPPPARSQYSILVRVRVRVRGRVRCRLRVGVGVGVKVGFKDSVGVQSGQNGQRGVPPIHATAPGQGGVPLGRGE